MTGKNKYGFDRNDFVARRFLTAIEKGRKAVVFPKRERIYAQGDPADAIFHILKGKVKLTVLSKSGEEATIRSPAGLSRTTTASSS